MSFWRSLFYPAEVYALPSIEERAATVSPLSIPMVVTTRQLVADTVASFPLVAKVGTDFVDPPRALLRRPDPREPASDTFERIVNAFTKYGGAWIRVTSQDARGFPLSIEYVDNPRVSYTLNAVGSRLLEVRIDGREVPLGSVRHIPFILDGGSPIGQSPLIQIDAALQDLNRAAVYAADFYGAGATPPYAITSPTRLGADQADKMLAKWQDARSRSRPAVLTGDLTLKTFDTQSAAEAQVLEAITALDATIARVMQVPPSLVNALSQSSLTYTTTLDESRRWLALGLNVGYLNRIESAFTDMLPRGMRAKFQTQSLTELDEQAQLDFDTDAIEAGILTIAEVRERRGLPPLTPQEQMEDAIIQRIS